MDLAELSKNLGDVRCCDTRQQILLTCINIAPNEYYLLNNIVQKISAYASATVVGVEVVS